MAALAWVVGFIFGERRSTGKLEPRGVMGANMSMDSLVGPRVFELWTGGIIEDGCGDGLYKIYASVEGHRQRSQLQEHVPLGTGFVAARERVLLTQDYVDWMALWKGLAATYSEYETFYGGSLKVFVSSTSIIKQFDDTQDLVYSRWCDCYLQAYVGMVLTELHAFTRKGFQWEIVQVPRDFNKALSLNKWERERLCKYRYVSPSVENNQARLLIGGGYACG